MNIVLAFFSEWLGFEVVLVGWLAGFFPVWNEEETSPSAKWLCEGKTVSGPVTDKCS